MYITYNIEYSIVAMVVWEEILSLFHFKNITEKPKC